MLGGKHLNWQGSLPVLYLINKLVIHIYHFDNFVIHVYHFEILIIYFLNNITTMQGEQVRPILYMLYWVIRHTVCIPKKSIHVWISFWLVVHFKWMSEISVNDFYKYQPASYSCKSCSHFCKIWSIDTSWIWELDNSFFKNSKGLSSSYRALRYMYLTLSRMSVHVFSVDIVLERW